MAKKSGKPNTPGTDWLTERLNLGNPIDKARLVL